MFIGVLGSWLACFGGDFGSSCSSADPEGAARTAPPQSDVPSLPPAKLRFAVLGDVPYDPPGERAELDQLRTDLATLGTVDWVVHLGDLKRGRDPCEPGTYTRAAEAMCTAPAPALVLPGDNEWNDCERTKDVGLDTVAAWRAWQATFGPDAARCERLVPPEWLGVVPQRRAPLDFWPGTSTGAFRFGRAGVRVLGLALPSFAGKDHGLPGTRGLMVQRQAISWLRGGLAGAPANVRAAVILLHADVLRPDSQQEAFAHELETLARRFDRPVLVLVGDSHAYAEQRPFEGVPLRYVVVTRGGLEGPLTVEVRPNAVEPFRLIRSGRRRE